MSTQTPTRDGTVLLTPADAARVANVSRDTIYREIERACCRPGTSGASSGSTRSTSATTSSAGPMPHDVSESSA